jgi:putative hydrolase of the HAD superfamily
MKKKYKHLIFDLDRTLWDFETNARIALNEIYTECDLNKKGIEIFDEFEHCYKTINEACWDDYRNGKLKKEVLRSLRFELTLKSFGIEDSELSENLSKLYLYKSPRLTTVIDGTHEILNYLHKKYQLHILTNGFVEVQGVKMEKSGLTSYFNHVIASEYAGAKKPHRQAFDFTIDRIKTNVEDCLMIGDDPLTDIKGAFDVGMDTVYFNPNDQFPSEYATYTINHLLKLKEIL